MTKPTTAPGSVQDALNYQFFLDRLDDPGLLDRAVVTEDNDLAVPVGGKRRGGYVGATSRAASRRLVQQLAARPDEFPVARLYYHSGAGWLVEWGAEPNWRDDHVIAGRHFGFSEAAIAAFVQMRAQRELEDGAE